MNNRIKEVREKLNFSRQKFGEELGLSGDVINNLERGRIEIKDDRILSICRTYNVNENWLRTGNGEMFCEDKDAKLAKLTSDLLIDDTSFKSKFISVLADLSEDKWAVLAEIAEKLANEMKKE